MQRRALEAFDVASTLPEAEQARWVDETCAGDLALRDAICRLLNASRRAAMMPTEVPMLKGSIEQISMPDRIGPYRPLEIIGSGGMGLVYRAERADGQFEQTVAIKVVSARLFGETATAQFLVERQILARLQHPHIAQLFDGGVAADGRPYLVMELIDGVPITDHCDDAALDPIARMQLVASVCEAVQHAHQLLVVHADLKPTNILVGARGIKLVDFGIGALVGDPAGPNQISGGLTPAWASPQLADGARPTPPDDIFALGLLIDALMPPARMTADLRAVIDRATAPAPADRYPSADALAVELARYCALRPVRARNGGGIHAAILFCRRNRLGVIATAAAALGLIVALIVTINLYLAADRARLQAQQRFDQVRALSRFMIDDVTTALEQFPGTSNLRHALAERGRHYLEQLSRIPKAPPDLRLEIAKGYEKTGAVLARNSGSNLGDPVAGRAALDRAERDLAGLLAGNPERDDIRVDLARTLVVKAAVSAISFNQIDRAYAELDWADRLLGTVAPKSMVANEARWVRWDGQNQRAIILDQEGRFAEMLPLLRKAIASGKQLPVPAARRIDRALYEGESLRLLGDAAFYSGDQATSLSIYKRAVEVIEQARNTSHNARLYDRAAYYHFDVASTLSQLGRSAEALGWIEKGIAIIASLADFDDSPRTRHVANILTLQRAETLGKLHRYDEAIAQMRENIAARRALAAAYPHNYEESRAVPVALRPMVELYFEADRIKEGCATLAEAQTMWAALARRSRLAAYDRSREMHDLAELGRYC